MEDGWMEERGRKVRLQYTLACVNLYSVDVTRSLSSFVCFFFRCCGSAAQRSPAQPSSICSRQQFWLTVEVFMCFHTSGDDPTTKDEDEDSR